MVKDGAGFDNGGGDNGLDGLRFGCNCVGDDRDGCCVSVSVVVMMVVLMHLMLVVICLMVVVLYFMKRVVII